jgi:tellurium resistance protein TerD
MGVSLAKGGNVSLTKAAPNAFIRVVDQADNAELARYDLSEDASTETAMVFGELYRNQGEWKFRAVGQGYASGLAGIAMDFGVNVG